MWQKEAEYNNRILILGTSTTGKSWLRDWIISQYIKHKKRRYYVVIDDRKNNAEMLYKKYDFHIEEINRSMINKRYNFEQFIRDKERVYILPQDLNNAEVKKLLNRLSLAVWNLTNTLLVIDEAYQFLKRGKYEVEEVERISRGGRKDYIDLMICTHKITDIPTDLLNLFNIYISFRTTEKNNLDKIKQYYDQFYNQSNKLIDNRLNDSLKKEIKSIISNSDRPRDIIKKLPNRFFMYSDTEQGKQEITSSEILSL